MRARFGRYDAPLPTPLCCGLQPGQTYFGDTSQATMIDNLPWEFWKISLVARDEVVLDWRDNGDATNNFAFWTPAANDYNFHQTPTEKTSNRGSISPPPASQELTFTVTAGTGVYPFAFYTNDGCLFCVGHPGPYQFVVYVKHALAVTLAPMSAVARVTTVHARVQDGAGNPYSGAETFGLWGQRGSGKYVKLAGATARNGMLTFHLKLDRSLSGQRLKLIVFHGADAGYTEARSFVRTVRVR